MSVNNSFLYVHSGENPSADGIESFLTVLAEQIHPNGLRRMGQRRFATSIAHLD